MHAVLFSRLSVYITKIRENPRYCFVFVKENRNLQQKYVDIVDQACLIKQKVNVNRVSS